MDLDDLLKSIREEGKGGKIVPAKFFGEDRYERYVEELSSQGTIAGETLTPEERKEGFKKRNDKIGFEEFVNKVLARKQAATVPDSGKGLGEGKGSAIVRSPGGSMQKFIDSPVSEGAENILESINDKLDDLLKTVREEQKLEEKSAEKERRDAEEKARGAKETKLEKGRFAGLRKATEKIVKPVKGILDRILDFLTKIILGNILLKIVDWFADKENQNKIKSVLRFIEDFWPALTAAVLLFGTGFGGLVTGLLKTVAGFSIRLLKIIPRFLKFFATPLGAALGLGAAVVGGAATGLVMQSRTQSNDPERAAEGKTQLDDTQDFGGTTGAPISADMLGFNGGGLVEKKITRTEPTQPNISFAYNGGGLVQPIIKLLGGGKVPVTKLIGGGKVPGSGPNRDTVPAMLSPGEFVMSRGAVKKYGAGNLAAMNAAGGGTNRPKISNNITFAMGGGMIEPKENLPETPILKSAKAPTNISNVTVTSKMHVAPSQSQRSMVSPPVRRSPQVVAGPIASGSNGYQRPVESDSGVSIPTFTASTSGSRQKLQTLGVMI